jgi:hypothetical protein
MSQEFKDITINKKIYSITNISAVDQLDLLHRIGAISSICKDNIDNIDTIIGVLISEYITKEDLFWIQETLSHSIREKGKEHTISINDFTGNIFGYMEIIANAIKFNLSDFFTYLRNAKQ